MASPVLQPATSTQLVGSAPARNLRWRELGLLLLCFFVPLWLVSFFAFLQGGKLTDRTTPHYLNMIVHECAALCLLAYILGRSKRGWKDLGLRFSFGQIGVGLGLFIAMETVPQLGYYVVQYAHFILFHGWAKQWDMSGIIGPTSLWVFFPFLVINPWFEEGIVRGYVMTELQELTGSGLVAVLGSTILQTGYHLYQGVVNATMVGTAFLLLSLYYVKTRKLLPVIVAHTAMDLYAALVLLHRLKAH